MPALLDKRLIVVTGKGGVGKTTVAVALGLAAARAGKRTMVAEVAQQERMSRAFRREGLGYSEAELADNLFGMSIDPERALKEYLGQQVGGALGGVLFNNRIFEYFAAAAPGVRELATIGKVWELAQLERRDAGAAPYDLVIVDAPASGHGLALLRSPRTFGDIARVGPIRRRADMIHEFLTDRRRTGVVAVALPQEMPVNETLEFRDEAEARDGHGHRHAVVVNSLLPERFSADEAERIEAVNGDHGSPKVAAALRAALSEHRRARGQRAQLRRLKKDVDDVVTLPHLFEPGARAGGLREAVGRAGAQAAVSVAELLEGKRIVICAGAGGVGKTTTSAAIAMGMAARGLKVAVLTIDPAKRLANSLGLPELGNEERQVDPERFAEAGLEMRGELWAMMLDAKRTWDEVIERHASDAKTRDAVFGNRIYQELSNAVAGSTEYMAMEKLYELHHEGRYDLLVLDTPPTRNALDFLDAPERLSRFVDSRSLQFFLKPGRLGLKVFGRGSGILFSVLKRVTGVDLLSDLSEFFQSFGDMAAGIGERAERVGELLGARETTFLLVTSPSATRSTSRSSSGAACASRGCRSVARW